MKHYVKLIVLGEAAGSAQTPLERHSW